MSETDVRPLIEEAAASGVRLWVEDGHLRFRAANGKLTHALRSALQSRKGELIGALSVPAFRKHAPPPSVVRCAADRIGFWRECEGDAALRHGTHCAFRLTGPIGRDRIEAAFERLISRHDLLRSRLEIADDGFPLLRICADPPAVEIVDLSRNATGASPAVGPLVERAVHAPFAEGQVFRAVVIRVSDSEHVVAIVIHHFVVDAFSVDLVVRDLVAGLLATRDSPVRMEDRPLQYADYLLGMSEWSAGPGLAYRLALWKSRMRNVRGVVFPAPQQDQRGGPGTLAVITIPIGTELRARLARAAATAGVPFPTAILAANFVALARTFRSRDFFSVLLYSGRDDPALADMVGSTIGSIPVRVTLHPQVSFSGLLLQVQDAFAFAVAYRVPWGILRPMLVEIGAGDPAPFFNYRFLGGEAASASSPGAHTGALQTEGFPFDDPKPSHIVDWKSYEIQAVDNGAALVLNLRYMPSVYRTDAIQAFAGTFLQCLETLADDPQREVAAIVR